MSLAWNIADHGYTVAAWNREPEMLGAHTYQRSDAPDEGFVQTDWLP